MRVSFIAAGIAAVAIVALAAHDDAFDYPYIPYDHASIQYPTGATDDAVSRLDKKIESGAVKLDYDPKFGYLPSLLKQLDTLLQTRLRSKRRHEEHLDCRAGSAHRSRWL